MILLDHVAGASEPLSLAELTRRSGLPKSSVLGICSTLVTGGLMHRTSGGDYQLGRHIVTLAETFRLRSSVTTQFAEAWDRLGELPEETVVLSVLDGADVVYVVCRNGTSGVTFNYRIGMKLPASCTASGKALLASLPRQELDRALEAGPLRKLTAQSLGSVTKLRAELVATAARGYAVDDEETREGMCCIGVPVFDAPGVGAVAAVAVSMLKAEFGTRKRARVTRALVRFAETFSAELGGVPRAKRTPAALQPRKAT